MRLWDPDGNDPPRVGSAHTGSAHTGSARGGSDRAGRFGGLAVAGRSRQARFRLRVARRVAAAGLAAAAVALGIAATRPPEPQAEVPVLVASRDLPVGSRLGPQDVQQRTVPAAVAQWSPAGPGDVSAVIGRVLAVPVAAGQILTDRSWSASAWLAGAPAGSVAVSVPVQGAGLLHVLRPGDRVRVLAPGTGAVVAAGTVLLCRSADGVVTGAAPGGAPGSGAAGPDPLGMSVAPGASFGGDRAPLLLLAVPPEQATALAAALPADAGAGFLLSLTA